MAAMLTNLMDMITECRTKAATETISKAASASAGATRATTQEVQPTYQHVPIFHSLLSKLRSTNLPLLPQDRGNDTSNDL